MHDAAHFRLNRSEAAALDPQTRLLLEVGHVECVQSKVPSDLQHQSRCHIATGISTLFVGGRLALG